MSGFGGEAVLDPAVLESASRRRDDSVVGFGQAGKAGSGHH